MKLADFQGRWRIERQIDDRQLVRRGTMQGTASFTPDDCGLKYSEKGILRFSGQPDLSAQQTYLWRADGNRIAILFTDGRPFHELDISAHYQSACHVCAPDTYRVHYDFTEWPDWTAQWAVTGPKKDYVMTTRYLRSGL